MISKERSERLRTHLLKLRQENQNSLETLRQTITQRPDVKSAAGDMLDAAQADAETSSAAELGEHHSHLVMHINRALRRLDDGTYGVCTRCERDISEKRLQAVPFTSLCRDCQEDSEELRQGQSISRAF